YIVTNYHVIEDVSLIRIRLADGTTLPGRVVARDAEHDLALLKGDASRPLPTMPLRTASDLMVGETVIAIGHAYGYDHTVTPGTTSRRSGTARSGATRPTARPTATARKPARTAP